ncbi:hypothetical protein GMRT_10589 [Giardia muris]|uniref:Uncharacterized protein n=1 Tax=Giardia muris TaxID=5742 RepID=A0A4Z1SMB7_GIAMU|nr:hypothetical protein GMRT_10589 [Giardia muris]|eukprot:TNJ26832.1 hypothetical protein GMRT_10589 [Giardia muris]
MEPTTPPEALRYSLQGSTLQEETRRPDGQYVLTHSFALKDYISGKILSSCLARCREYVVVYTCITDQTGKSSSSQTVVINMCTNNISAFHSPELPPLHGASLTHVGTGLFLHGGETISEHAAYYPSGYYFSSLCTGRRFNTTYTFLFDEKKWELLETQDKPPGSAYHTASALNQNTLSIEGGGLEATYHLNTKTLRWYIGSEPNSIRKSSIPIEEEYLHHSAASPSLDSNIIRAEEDGAAGPICMRSNAAIAVMQHADRSPH